MYTTCDCIKRNGLQDKCPRSLCQGRSACMCFPTPNCCPSSFPLRYANMTMGVIKKKNNRRAGGGNGNGNGNGSCCSNGNCCISNGCGCTCNPCSDPAYCGLSNPQCGAPSPIPCSPTPRCCPPLPEGGIPDPRVWNSCNTPQVYPCPPCPSRYLKHKDGPCIWPCPCEAHCYDTPPTTC
ncbi:keratin-associated protein 2-2-like [Glossina fuscipes]|uniref:Keratin-associated protein 2-2-like n=1 Tax=Glossina fuscipes TaxID=7396 RepID=A0A9C6DPW8_9MUSC|nr:keratin-associated protein 2-2-like [Glossina fuscipes]